MARPAFYVLAGPNGSGKTTFALNDPALKNIAFINADIEAQRLSPGSPAKAAVAAGRTTPSNITVALALAERARVFDNSTGVTPKLVLEMREQSIMFLRRELPNWFKTAFRMDGNVVDPIRYVEGRLQELLRTRK